MELVTNRTQEHVDRLKLLQEKGWLNLSSSEKADWIGVAAKGAYNYTDLNRVESAVAEIGEALGLSLTTKTDWTVWDVPTQSDMARYLGNIEKIREAAPNRVHIAEPPIKMGGLDYKAANLIEEILMEAHMGAEALPRTGEVFCGEV